MTKEKKWANLTGKQIRALVDLYEASGATSRWRHPECLDGGSGRILSGLICYDLVEGKHVRAARRTDYRLTEIGLRITQPHANRLLAANVRKSYRKTEEYQGFSPYSPPVDDVYNPTVYTP